MPSRTATDELAESAVASTSHEAPAGQAIARPAGAVVRPRSSRLANWDRLRLLSFCDIAAFHMTGRYLLLGMGLPTFLVLRFALASRLPVPEPTRKFIHVRVEKLLVPWAAWSLLFGALIAAQSLRKGIPLGEVFTPYMLLYGTSDHLWFLPFAALVGILVHFIDVATQRVPTRIFVAAAGVTGMVLVWVTHLLHPLVDQQPFRQWIFGAPSVPIGLMLGRILARPWKDGRRVWAFLLAACTVMIALILLQRPAGGRIATEPFRYTLTVGLVALAALLPGGMDRWTSKLTPLLLGGYLLLDVLYEQTLGRLVHARGWDPAPVVLVAVMAPATLLLVAALRKTGLKAIL